jgi:hypothetical protein
VHQPRQRRPIELARALEDQRGVIEQWGLADGPGGERPGEVELLGGRQQGEDRDLPAWDAP